MAAAIQRIKLKLVERKAAQFNGLNYKHVERKAAQFNGLNYKHVERKPAQFRALVVTQLVEWSLLAPEVCSSNPGIGKIYIECLLSTALKRRK